MLEMQLLPVLEELWTGLDTLRIIPLVARHLLPERQDPSYSSRACTFDILPSSRQLPTI